MTAQLYRASNRAGSGWWVLAEDEEQARAYSVARGRARKPENIQLHTDADAVAYQATRLKNSVTDLPVPCFVSIHLSAAVWKDC
jgi:hypothetical protein